MPNLRRSVSLPSFEMGPVPDSYIYIHSVQNQAQDLLTAMKLKEEKQAAHIKKIDLEEKIEGAQDCLGKIIKRVAELECITQRYNLLQEQDRIVEGLEAKVNKIEKGDIENLIEYLSSSVSKLLVKNFALPKTETDKKICQILIKTTLETLKEYDKLQSSNTFNLKNLANLISTLELLNIRTQKTAEKCSALEKEVRDQVSEHNAKKTMLEIKKRYYEKSQCGKRFLPMSKLVED